MDQATEHDADTAGREERDAVLTGSARWQRTAAIEILGPAQDSGLRNANIAHESSGPTMSAITKPST